MTEVFLFLEELGPMTSQKGTAFIDWKTVMHIPELVSSIQLGLIVNFKEWIL